jgi:hypothetical protein
MLGTAKRVHDRQGKHHDHRRRGQEEGHRGPLQPDPRAGRGDHLGLRPREAAGAPGQAVGRRRRHQGRRRHRGRGQGAQGSRRRRDACDPGRGRGGHRAGGGTALLYASRVLDKVATAPTTTSRSASTSSAAPCRRRSARSPRTPAMTAPWWRASHAGKQGPRTSASTPRPASTATWSRPASSIRPRSCAHALQGAASVAGLLITTEAMVADAPKPDNGGPPAMPGGGMGGMGF